MIFRLTFSTNCSSFRFRITGVTKSATFCSELMQTYTSFILSSLKSRFPSFVEKKKNQCWLWLAYAPKHRQMLAFSLGRRTDESLRNLLDKLSAVQITRFYTDNWESYRNLIPEVRHWIGKAGIQRIERQNLNFRTHLKRLQRRTICFSKSKKMLEAIVRLYIHQLNSSSISFVT